MSLFANAYGNFLGSALPYFQSMPGIVTPYGTLLKPGGRIAAYVRSTGALDGEDHFAQSGMLVSSINLGLARCRAGQNDIVYVLPGHTETHSVTGAIWSNLVAGAQIIGVGNPGSTNNPNVTLSHTGASMALSAANVTVAGLNINSATAAVTGAIVASAAGCTLAGNFIVFSGALAANVGVLASAAPNFSFIGNHYVCNSTTYMLNLAGATTTNVLVLRNYFRQSQGTSGGSFVGADNDSGISGLVAFNIGKTATAGTPGTGFDLDAANVIANLQNEQNYSNDNVATSGVLATGAIFA